MADVCHAARGQGDRALVLSLPIHVDTRHGAVSIPRAHSAGSRVPVHRRPFEVGASPREGLYDGGQATMSRLLSRSSELCKRHVHARDLRGAGWHVVRADAPAQQRGAEQLEANSVGGTEIRRRPSGRSRFGTARFDCVTSPKDARVASRRAGTAGVTFFQSVNSCGRRREWVTQRALMPSAPTARVVAVQPFGGKLRSSRVASHRFPWGRIPTRRGTGMSQRSRRRTGASSSRTFDSDGQPAQYPFNLIVAC